MAVRTMLWYQGESNVGQAPFYACAFPALIEQYRTLLPSLAAGTFGFVLIAPFVQYFSNAAAGDLRQAQLEPVRLGLDRLVFAQTLDLVYPYSAIDDIHPTYKQAVGARLAAQLLVAEYAFPASPALAQPLYAEAAEASTGQVLSVEVTLSGCEGLSPCLQLIDAPEVPPGLLDNQTLGWAIQTDDAARTWWPAQAKLTPAGLLLSSSVPFAAGARSAETGGDVHALATAYARATYPLVYARTPLAADGSGGLPLAGWCFRLDGSPCYASA